MNLQQLKALPPGELRIKVAEALGWEENHREFGWLAPELRGRRKLCSTTDIPDYPNDLNACAEFEAKMDDVTYEKYDLQLFRLARSARDARDPKGTSHIRHPASPASQRCIAFLLTMEK